MIKSVYVCLVSDHNIVELEACLLHKPSDLVLVVTEKMAEAAARLKKVIEKKLPETRVHITKSTAKYPLKGEEVENAFKWVSKVLKPALKSLKAEKYGLNMTGGTKILALAVAQARQWDWIDYKGWGNEKLESFALNNTQQVKKHTPPVIDVISAVALYANECVQSKESPWSHLDAAARAVLAQEIWDALEGETTASDQGLSYLFELFAQAWYPKTQDRIEIDPAKADFDGSRFNDWIEKFQKLLPNSLRREGHALHFGAEKRQKNWRQWIGGGWLEELAYAWLKNAGLPEEQMALNLRDNADSAQSREVDLAAVHRGTLMIIEAKADKDSKTQAKSFEEQISSIGERYGRSTKLLFLGPEAQRSIKAKGKNKNAWTDFEKRCKGSHVSVITSRAALLKAAKLGDFVADVGGTKREGAPQAVGQDTEIRVQ